VLNWRAFDGMFLRWPLGRGRAALRSLWLAAAVLGAALVCSSCGGEGEKTEAENTSPPADRPNVVLILADDLDKTVFERSTLDSVWAPQGTSFTNALATTPVCCPSRASILRGQYAHNTGLWRNSNDQPNGGAAYFRDERLDQRTLATILHANGYKTWFGGKYLNDYMTAGGSQSYVPPGWDSWQAYLGGTAANVNGRATSFFPRHYTDWLSDRAEAFIEDQRGSSQPFYMHIAPLDTHEPLSIPPRHRNAYLGQRTPRPPSFDEANVSDKPAWVRGKSPISKRRAAEFDQRQVKRMQSALTLEDLCRNVIDALERTDQLGDTYLIFTSDNGYHMGLHRIREAKGSPYTESQEVPFVVRGPGVPAGESFDQLVANIDIAPTVLDLAGVEVPSWMDGRSLRPFFDGTAPGSWRMSLLMENMEGPGERAPRPPYSGVRHQDEVYVEYGSGEAEYYDLKADPYQLENRPQDAPQAIKDQLAALKDCAGNGCRKADHP
jgi:N-acetylglucosamine-6-sulfatase